MKLIFSPAAIHDLQSVATYTFDNWGSDQEKLYIEGLWKKLEEIRKHPETHRYREHLKCQSARHGKHVIFFISVAGNVNVIRILHSAMDFSTHLPDDDE